MDLSQIITHDESTDLALEIAEKTLEEKYDFLVIQLNRLSSMEGNDPNKYLPDAKMVYQVLRLTYCPILTFPKWPGPSSIRTILQPIDFEQNIIGGVEQVLTMAKIFNANIHILLVNNQPGRKVYKACTELLDVVMDLFNEYAIRVKPKIINHCNKTDTILAYASIIEADMISNGIGHFKEFGKSFFQSTWSNLINRSEIPLYNYYG